jgi:hypothetical protein
MLGKVVRFKSGQRSIAAILPLQLVHQVPEMGRQFGVFRAKVLLQPFADGAADRSAGGAIDLFAAFVDSVHRGFRFALVVGLTSYQVIRAGIVSPADRLHAFCAKIE